MSERPDPLVERALASSYPEGALAQVAGTITDHYLAAFALFLGAGAGEIGVLAAATKLGGALAQASAASAARLARDRRRLLMAGALLQGAALAPVALVALRPGASPLSTVLVAATAYSLLGGLMYPAWASLMSEYLPADRRGRFFGRRNRWLAAWSLLGLALCGLVLDAGGPLRSGAAFCALFALAAACRAGSTLWMSRLAPRPLAEARRSAPLNWRGRLDGRLGRLIAYAACAAFASQLADSMQPVRLLSALRLSYRDFMLLKLAGVAGAAATAAWWGRQADRRGPARVLRAAGILMAVSPAAWALSSNARVLAAFEPLHRAAAAGFGLCLLNCLYEAVPEAERMQAIGLYTLSVGAAAAAASALAGSLVGSGVAVTTVFASSCALRLAVELSAGPRLSVVMADPTRTHAPPGWTASSATTSR